jgi:ATP-dependent Clp protease protease subunit
MATYCLGQAASMGSLLLQAGTKGKRFCMPNGRIMIHQPHIMGNGISGQVTDIEIHTQELIKTKKKLVDIYVRHTGKEHDHLYKMMERDYYMGATEAKELGLIDNVVEFRKSKGS